MADRAKLNLRLPVDLHTEATALAESLGISLNAFCVLAVRNWVDYQGDKAQARTKSRSARLPASPAPAASARPPTPTAWAKTGRNEPCPCGSGKKFKFCHCNG